ncbi:hypothetical protein VN0692_14590 [Helicobacter pylori]
MLEMKVPVLSATLREVWQALILKKKCSHFKEEMLSFNRNGDTRLHKIALGSCVKSLATYIFLRTLRLIHLRQFHIFKPGLLKSWNIINGTYSNKIVLRNTFCDYCSKNTPKRAIRDMI